MPSTYEQFREAVLKAASPEHKAEILMKLKYCPNCNDEIGYDKEADMYFCGNCSHPMSSIDIDKLVRNYTRDLTLEDVLRAIGQTKEYKLISHIEENISAIMLAPRGWSSDGKIYIKWFMGKPVHLQSDETLLEIIKILK